MWRRVLVNNDTLSGALSISAGQFSGVGAYAINQGTLAHRELLDHLYGRRSVDHTEGDHGGSRCSEQGLWRCQSVADLWRRRVSSTTIR